MTAWVLSYGIGKVERAVLAIPYREFLVIQLIPLSASQSSSQSRFGWPDSTAAAPSSCGPPDAMAVLRSGFGLFISPPLLAPVRMQTSQWLPSSSSSVCCLMVCPSVPCPHTAGCTPTNVRYTASGIAYNVASILGAALTLFVAVWLNTSYSVSAVGGYRLSLIPERCLLHPATTTGRGCGPARYHEVKPR